MTEEDTDDEFPEEPIFEMSSEWGQPPAPHGGRGQLCTREMRRTGEARRRVGEEEGEEEGGSDDEAGPKEYVKGLPGTTPPIANRYMKMARKGHKHKSSKKLSPGNFSKDSSSIRPELKKRPQSMIALSALEDPGGEGKGAEDGSVGLRRHTVHEVKVRGGREGYRKERRTRGNSGGGGEGGGGTGASEREAQGDDKASRRRRKQESKRRKKDRDDKASLHEPRPSATLVPPQIRSLHHASRSLDFPDFAGGPLPLAGSDESFLTGSLQPGLLQRVAPGSPRQRVRRSKSDAQLIIGFDEHQSIHCPPERKQFYRHFLRALKYSGITQPPRPRMDTPVGLHMPRQFSENLTLRNPFGHVFDEIWLELQAYFNDKSLEEQQADLFYKTEYVDKVLTRILNFELPLEDPDQSLNTLFFGVTSSTSLDYNKDEYEAMGPPSLESNSTLQDGGGENAATVVVDDKAVLRGHGVPQQDSVESKTSDESVGCQCTPNRFLSTLQIFALSKVQALLWELEVAESYFANRQRMGDEHRKYRTAMFRRRMQALVLWQKVVKGLADRLCSLSSWLGVPVVIPDVCREAKSRSRATSFDKPPSPLTRSRSGSDPPVALSSPKSPLRFQFQVGSPGSPKDELEQSLMSQRLKHLPSIVSRSSTSGSSYRSQATLQRLFSGYQSVSLEESRGPYRVFVDRGLKKRGLTRLISSLFEYIDPILKLAQFAMTPLSETEQVEEPEEVEERRPLLRAFLPPALTVNDSYHPRVATANFNRSTSACPECWTTEFEVMSLPLFGSQYIQLLHVPLDVMHECLRLQIELRRPHLPSPHSVKQLVRECRETLEKAIEVRKFYRSRIEAVIRGDVGRQEQVDNDIEMFEEDLRRVLLMYFVYLQSWVQVSSGHILEEEWKHVKEICTHIRGGEAEAGRRFCDMASHLLDSTGVILEVRMDECCRILHRVGECSDRKRAAIGESCRSFKELFVEIRERASKALGFAKMLRKDLEIAADFMIQVEPHELLSTLKASDHIMVVLPSLTGKVVFVPESTGDSVEEIQQLLSVSFAHGQDQRYDPKDSYLLLLAMDSTHFSSQWNGKTVSVKASAESTVAIAEIQVESLKMVVSNSANLTGCRNSFLSAVGNTVKLVREQTSSHQNVAERIGDLKMSACELAKSLMSIQIEVWEHLSIEDMSTTADLSIPYQGTMHACFNLGFEYVREVFRLLGDDLAYQELGEEMMEYAQQWMRFVIEKCERGRGTRPRWAMMGLDFLTVASAPRILATISNTRFEALKKLMNKCLGHVIGEAPPPPSIQRPNIHPSPTKVGLSNRKPWCKTPRLGYNNRTVSAPITRVEEEEVFKLPHSDFCSGTSRPVHETVTIEEEALMYAVPVAAPSPSPRMEQLVVMGPPLLATAVDQESLLAVVGPTLTYASPPVSTGSTESVSSGHDSPRIQTGDMTNTVSYLPFTPVSSTKRHLASTPSMERTDSNSSTSSANAFYSSYAHASGSFSSQDSSDGVDRVRQKIQEKVKLLEKNREEKLYHQKVIGRATERQHSSLHEIAKLSNLKQTHFKWQRGRKLGEGRFGKVYECFNLDTGEINAVKQISIQEKDSGAIQTIVDEITFFQKVFHPNIVKFYGVEVHHNELYLFMEYCNEGTLWSIARQGLPEPMIRQYTRDILKAVYALHDRGIIHRDIKGANVFLSLDGSVKLGDFGLSVQLKNFNKTLPNEIKQQVGTVPYMSPEVILKQEMGRPMDIWSVGCVVVEMATGKLPWSELDHQFQIMYQLGMGNSPPIPDSALSPEGHEFLSHCFENDPNKRWRAGRLLDDPFVKISSEHSSSSDGD